MKRSIRLALALGTSSFLALALSGLSGCGGDDSGSGPALAGGEDGPAGAAGAAKGGEAGEGTGVGGAGGAGGGSESPPPLTRKTVSGDATWNIVFDADAKAAGATDCSYTRHYEGVEDESRPWYCPSCEIVFNTTVQMTAGQEDCYTQVSDTDPLEEEWIGYGGGRWFRGALIMSDQGAVALASGSATYTHDVQDVPVDVLGTGTMQFGISGAFTFGEEDGDPMHGWVASDTYSCSWPKADPDAYTGDYKLVEGAQLPDGTFKDVCEDVVRLHDFKGKYVVVIMAARDCPACQSMAQGEESEFFADMEARNIDAEVITLMAPSLRDPIGETSTAILEYWIDKFDLKSVVLADRAWAVSMFLPLFPEDMGYPSWVVTDPDLNVLRYGAGADWTSIKSAILANAD